MALLTVQFVSFCVVALLASSRAASYLNETNVEFYEKQNRLLSHVLSGYRKDIPPLRTRGYPTEEIKPMVINITLEHVSLLSIDWTDSRLVWNASDFDDIQAFYINQNLIWRPDIMIFNSRFVTDVASDAKHAYVKSNGDVSLFVYNAVSFLCLMNVRSFPFDKQVCSIEFASYAFSSQELHLNSIMPKHYNSVSASSNEWIVDDIAFETIVLRDSAGDDDYYRIGCGLSAILAMCTVLQIAEQTIPKTRELSSLSIYIMFNLILVAIAISIVVIGSKHCTLPRFSTCCSLKGWFHRLDFMLNAEFRMLCLLIFPVATVTNLLILVHMKEVS